ncbi:alkaline ceramidase 3-like [Liolophura sinensis]|uniref:alkaline ceramidase 3-like n=1 Tax=Liolophura sinensis TaxID=3198878 RepID=UPI003158DCF5
MPSLYVDAGEGYWGKRSSTIDWCEENYVVTHYIAEFWNTISNLIMIIPPLLCAVYYLRNGLETRLVMCQISLLAVGLGSWCFHMTLLYSMQLLDELPMIWGTSFLLYSLLELEKPLFTRNQLLQVGLFMYCLVVTVIYLLVRNPLFFQGSYGLMVFAVVMKSWHIISRHGWKLRLKIHVLALLSYCTGVILWLIDQHYCSSVRALRQHMGPGLGTVTQLHALWHLCAGFGTYIGILFGFHSRYVILRKRPQVNYLLGVWPYLDLEQPLRSL